MEEDATVKLCSLGYARGESQATARDPEVLSSSTASGVESSSSCSCRGRAQAEEQEGVAELRELGFKKEDHRITALIIIIDSIVYLEIHYMIKADSQNGGVVYMLYILTIFTAVLKSKRFACRGAGNTCAGS